jgi:hypothetical protein
MTQACASFKRSSSGSGVRSSAVLLPCDLARGAASFRTVLIRWYGVGDSGVELSVSVVGVGVAGRSGI